MRGRIYRYNCESQLVSQCHTVSSPNAWPVKAFGEGRCRDNLSLVQKQKLTYVCIRFPKNFKVFICLVRHSGYSTTSEQIFSFLFSSAPHSSALLPMFLQGEGGTGQLQQQTPLVHILDVCCSMIDGITFPTFSATVRESTTTIRRARAEKNFAKPYGPVKV
jgi:hypothetical protein